MVNDSYFRFDDDNKIKYTFSQPWQANWVSWRHTAPYIEWKIIARIVSILDTHSAADDKIKTNRAEKHSMHVVCDIVYIVALYTYHGNSSRIPSHVMYLLTHWGRVTHICVNKQTIIGSVNGLSPGRSQAVIWTNGGILGTNVNEILNPYIFFQ